MNKKWRVKWWDWRKWKTEYRYFDRLRDAVRCYLGVIRLELSAPTLAPRLHDPEKTRGGNYSSQGSRFDILLGGVIGRYKRTGKDFDLWGVPASEWLKIIREAKRSL